MVIFDFCYSLLLPDQDKWFNYMKNSGKIYLFGKILSSDPWSVQKLRIVWFTKDITNLLAVKYSSYEEGASDNKSDNHLFIQIGF